MLERVEEEGMDTHVMMQLCNVYNQSKLGMHSLGATIHLQEIRIGLRMETGPSISSEFRLILRDGARNRLW